MPVSQEDLERRVSWFARVCRRRGFRITHQRMAVFREVAGTKEHPDAETVYRRVRHRVAGISRDTVYRALATLEDEGLIRRAETLGGPARYDANLERHHHFVCVVCGRMKDFRSEALDRLPIPESVAAWGRIEIVQVQVRGVCSACADRKRESRSASRPGGAAAPRRDIPASVEPAANRTAGADGACGEARASRDARTRSKGNPSATGEET